MRRILAGMIEFLKSTEAILLVLILALGAQLPHTAVVFQRVSTTALDLWAYGINAGTVVDLAHATMAAIAVEIAVLVFVVRGRSLLSWGFAVASATMNMIYYWRPGWRITEPTVLMIGAILWAVLLPAAIAFYSHEIGDGKNGIKVTFGQRLGNLLRWLSPQPTNAVVAAPATVTVAAGTNGTQPKPKATRTTSTGATNGDAYANGNVVGFDAFADVIASTIGGSINGSAPSASKPNGSDEIGAVSQVDRVGQMKSEGLSTKDIARELGVSESTVRVYAMQYRNKNVTNQDTGEQDEE